MTSKKETGISSEQANWEKELAEDAEGDHVEPEPVEETPQEGQQKVEAGHPLNGEAVKIVDDVIDFQQHVTLMTFCHKLAAG